MADDDLAYGDYHGHGGEEETDRGFLGDAFKRFTGRARPQEQGQQSPHLYNQPPQPASNQFSHPQSQQPPNPSSGTANMSLFDKMHSAVHSLGSELKSKLNIADIHSHTHQAANECHEGAHEEYTEHRYLSFSPPREGNDAKWYVDACGYMWAVSKALEEAKDTVWILDWWLSPELYLRRPPAKNEKYRIDNMLKAAAERGVKVNIIVYKEVTQALTLSSSHTKHALEDCHRNICVFRHPDHLPDKQTIASDFLAGLQNIKLSAANAVKLPGNALSALYGTTEDTVLYWAHHEKLCLVDGHTAFMGGLDLCYGRWDTNQHSIADAHPGDVNRIVFAGQDYNNSRIMDFQDVTHWQNNKLERTENSRMGWSDISICLKGPVVQDLHEHFVQRWNFIYDEKYQVRKDDRYCKLVSLGANSGVNEDRGLFDPDNLLGEEGGLRQKFWKKGREHMHYGGGQQQPQSTGHDPLYSDKVSIQLNRSCAKWSNNCKIEHSIANAYIDVIKNSQHFVYIENQFFITATVDAQRPITNKIGAAIVERIIRAARNGEKYKMVVLMPAVPAFAGDLKGDDALGTRAIMEFQYNSINRGGHSIYETIAREGINPMDYIRFYNLRNYDRINSSGAMKQVEQSSGVRYEDARKQYDAQTGGGFAQPVAIDATSSRAIDPHAGQYQPYRPPGTSQAPAELSTDGAGQSYYPPPPAGGPPQQAMYAQPMEGYGQQPQYAGVDPLGKYQEAAQGMSGPLSSGKWDSVASCYMLHGEDIRNVPWEAGNIPEIDAFVTEELYIHSKLLIADDRVVICGSANLNDRSQLGDHDSEIAVVIEDHNVIDSTMNNAPWRVNKFAASLRRQIFRKHLGLLKPQDYETEEPNYLPVGVPNEYDWGSEEDRVVIDPLSDDLLNLWNTRAHTNTEVFGKVFHPVPHDAVKNWKQYDEWYEQYFKAANPKDKDDKPGKYKVGHVVSELFPGGVQEVKEELAKVKGTLVEMPLLFLKEEDIAKEGLGLNAFVEDLYT
ncbi:phospholipase D/nuclease [Venturia nashicola]|nr:phospholipase D/nuclease [Venturia nashicola]